MKPSTLTALRTFAEDRLEFLLKGKMPSTEMWCCALFLLVSEDKAAQAKQQEEKWLAELTEKSEPERKRKAKEAEQPAQ